MTPDPREPHDIAQEIMNDDSDAMEELLKDTEVEDEDIDEEEFDSEPAFEDSGSDSDGGGYF